MIPALFALMLIAEEPTQVAAPEATEVQKPKKEKKICRVEDHQTGTRMQKKTCLTQIEWDLRAQGRDAADLKTLGGR